MTSPDNYCIIVESGLLKIDVDSVIADFAITGTNVLLESGLSAIDADDLTGGGIIIVTKYRRQGRFPLMRLPAEIRLNIFSFLLPDMKPLYSRRRGRFPGPASFKNFPGRGRYRHDFAPGNLAIMRSNRQIYDETTNYLYNRSTLVVSVDDDGVNLLSSHWGCGEMSKKSLKEIPFNKFQGVWLQIQATLDQRKHLNDIRRNLLNFCIVLCQTDPLKGLRVDLFDSRHCDAGRLDPHEATYDQGGVKMITRDIEDIMRRYSCTQEIAERETWRAVNSTGTSLAATDIEAIVQPLKLLCGVERCQIFLNAHLQSDKSLVELATLHEDVVQSKGDLTLADLTSVFELSEELYRLASTLTRRALLVYYNTEKEKRMEHLLWQTRKRHKLPCTPIEEFPSRWRGYDYTIY